MEQFLITYRPARSDMLMSGPTESEAAIVSEHFGYLVQLFESGKLAFAGRTQDDNESTLGLAVIRCSGQSEADSIVEADPAVAGKVFVGKVLPYAFALGGEKMWP